MIGQAVMGQAVMGQIIIGQILWQPGRFSWVILAAALVLMMQAIIVYRRAEWSPGPIQCRALFTIRISVIALLAVAGFRPSWVSQSQRSGPQRVLLMLDNSRSMNTVDGNRSTTHLLEFARATGAIPASAEQSRYRDAARLLRTLADRIVEQRRAEGRDDAQVRLTSTKSALTQLRELCRGQPSVAFIEAELPKAEESLGTAAGQAVVLKTIERLIAETARIRDAASADLIDADYELNAQIDGFQRASRFELAKTALTALSTSLSTGARVELQLLQGATRVGELQSLTAEQMETPLARSLRQAVESTRSQSLDGIVLFTDGRSTESGVGIPPVVSAAGIPVFPVLMAPGDRQPDVRVASIEAPGEALAGETAELVVRVRSRDAEGRTVVVKLSDGKSTQSQSLTIGPADAVVRFESQLIDPGTALFEASIDPAPGETLAESTPLVAQTRVLDKKVRIALVGREMSAEADALDRLLLNVPWIQYTRDVNSTAACRITPADLATQDVVILAGTAWASLSSPQIEAVTNNVLQESKSLLLLDTSGELLSKYLINASLAKTLSVAPGTSLAVRERAGDNLAVFPSQQAAQLTLARTEASAEASLRNWMARPAMPRTLELTPLLRSGAPILIDRGTRVPLAVEVFAGSGRSVVMGIARTHAWRASDHQQFWCALLRHLADPAPDVSVGDLSIATDREEIIVGRAAEIFCRSRNPSAGPVQLALRLPDRSLESLALAEVIPGSGRWTARVVPRVAGDCVLVLHQGTSEITWPLRVLPDEQIEMSNLAPDPGFLQRIAAATGGAMFTFDQLAEVAPGVNRLSGQRPRRIEHAAWCSPYFFGLIVGLLGLEWSLRKHWGLA
ncbi:MAG: VWA domain-containing protein [Burkholderiales bacterium]|nr:VWA domain-containing protein [Phycisphaerae bacterium]